MKEDDNNWPEPDRVGRQELEIVMGNEHISFTTSKIGSLVDVQSSKDPEGLRIFYYLVQVSLSTRFYSVFLLLIIFDCKRERYADGMRNLMLSLFTLKKCSFRFN